MTRPLLVILLLIGTALAFACALYDLECEVWQVGSSYDSKPFRRLMIEAFGQETGVPVGFAWMDEVKQYEKEVQSKRK